MKKEFLKILFFNLFFLIIILLVLELTVRIFKLSGMQGYQAEILHDEIHRLKPNTEGETGGVKFYTDSKGFRVPYKNYNYKEADKILFLGDSVTFGVGVKEEDSFVGKYRKNSLRDEYYNLSLFGYQIKHYSVQIKELDSLSPIKKMFYFITLNDVYDQSNLKIARYAENRYQDGFKRIFNLIFFRKVNAFLRDRSYLYTFLKGILVDPQKSWFQNVLNYYEQNDLDLFKSFLVDFTEFTKDKGIRTAIFILPYEFQTRKCDKKILLPQAKIREISRNIDNNFFDLTSNFCEYDNPKKLFLKYDPMHLSPEGHEFVYSLTKKYILK